MHCYCKYAALCRHGLPLIRHTPRDDFQSRIVPTDCLEYLVWVYELHGLTWLVLYPNIAGRSVVLTIPKWLWYFLGGRVNQQPAGFPMCKYRQKIMYIIIHSNIVVDIIHIIHTVTYSEQQNSLLRLEFSLEANRSKDQILETSKATLEARSQRICRSWDDIMGIWWVYNGDNYVEFTIYFTFHVAENHGFADILWSVCYILYTYIYIYIAKGN